VRKRLPSELTEGIERGEIAGAIYGFTWRLVTNGFTATEEPEAEAAWRERCETRLPGLQGNLSRVTP
jgi:hypothetical protein